MYKWKIQLKFTLFSPLFCSCTTHNEPQGQNQSWQKIVAFGHSKVLIKHVEKWITGKAGLFNWLKLSRLFSLGSYWLTQKDNLPEIWKSFLNYRARRCSWTVLLVICTENVCIYQAKQCVNTSYGMSWSNASITKKILIIRLDCFFVSRDVRSDSEVWNLAIIKTSRVFFILHVVNII